MNNTFLESLFKLLTTNKEFPNYQAERRIDIFINYFLAEMLTNYMGKNVEFVCPEFPLKKAGNYQSTKLDYLCKTNDEIVFVELKTDASSLKKEQADIYLKSSWSQCLIDLKKIYDAVKNKTHKKKYEVLMTTINTIERTEVNTGLKVFYISPLPNEKSDFLNAVSIISPKHFKDLKLEITEQEQIVWNYLIGLDLYIFEINNKL